MEELQGNLQNATQKVTEKLASWGESLVLQLPNLIIAIVVFFVAMILVGYVKKGARKIAKRSTSDLTIINLISSVAAVIFSILVGLIILSIFNLNGVVNKFLATAGVLGLAVGLALQDPLTNMFSGVIMSVRNIYNIGDIVETNGIFGTIREISLRSTIIATPQGQIVTIPNKDVVQQPLKNFSREGTRRLDLSCGVSYSANLRDVRKIAKEAVSHLENRDESRDIMVFFTEFGDSSINFILQVWMHFDRQADFNKFRNDAIIAVKEAFDNAGINIPFPIRTLDVNPSIIKELKSGTKISD